MENVVNNNRCQNCFWFATKDSGYSNWTVEETTCYCIKKLNPHFPCPECYSWEVPGSPTKDHAVLRVAETCGSFRRECGEQIRLDADGDVKLADFCEELQLAAKAYGMENYR
jgi:hypothetical protein